MSLVSTMPEKGQQAKVYDIPDADLAKYEAVVEGTMAPYAEAKEKIAGGKELAGGMDLDKADVLAYSDICVCYFWWHGVLYYRYCYNCNQDCP